MVVVAPQAIAQHLGIESVGGLRQDGEPQDAILIVDKAREVERCRPLARPDPSPLKCNTPTPRADPAPPSRKVLISPYYVIEQLPTS